MKEPRCVYSLDWLQVYCTYTIPPTNDYCELTSPQADKWGNHRVYKIVQAQEYIHGYKEQRAIKWRQYIIAIVAWSPIGSRKDMNAGAIKLANPVLYTSDWHFILSDLLATFSWEAKNLTRVDLACDFNYFQNGLHPETFIRQYICKSSNTYIRKNSNKWAAIGTKEMAKNTFDYLRWGSRQSGISTYLYNKSKELQEQKYKPWIVNLWKQHALDVTKVWRVEFSISSSGRGLKDVHNEIIHSLWVDDLYREQAIKNIFCTFAKEYFCFYWLPKGAPKRKKDLKEVNLLNIKTDIKERPTTLYEGQKSARTEYITLKRLNALREEIEESHDMNKMRLWMSLQDVINEYAQRSHYAHMCDTFRKDMKEEIKAKVSNHPTIQEYKERAESCHNIKRDKTYLEEVSDQIARKIATLSMEGILQNIRVPSSPEKE